MKPEEISSLLLAATYITIESTANFYKSIPYLIDFLKITEAVRKQNVGFSHFKNVLKNDVNNIEEMYNHYERIFYESHLRLIKEINELLQMHELVEESPLGVIIYNTLSLLDSLPVFSITNLVKNYREWKAKDELNFLPLLLTPLQIFDKEYMYRDFSPLPSYVTNINLPENLEQILSTMSDDPQALLYLAILHAHQRKTSKASEEAQLLSLKMTKSDDDSVRSRAAISLAHIYSLFGLKNESLLSLDESINEAKHLDDVSILSAAVAMKAKIENSQELWNHASNLAKPSPEAVIRRSINDDGLSGALKLNWPYSSALIYSTYNEQYSSIITMILPDSEELLVKKVLGYLQDCEWRKCARLLKKFDPCNGLVRAASLATAVLYYDINEYNMETEEFKEELSQVLSITTLFTDKNMEIFNEIQNLTNIDEEKDVSYVINQPTCYQLLWTYKKSMKDPLYVLPAARLSTKCHAYTKFLKIVERLDNVNIDLDIPKEPIVTLSEKELIEWLSIL